VEARYIPPRRWRDNSPRRWRTFEWLTLAAVGSVGMLIVLDLIYRSACWS
jgi:hypothetical protein